LRMASYKGTRPISKGFPSFRTSLAAVCFITSLFFIGCGGIVLSNNGSGSTSPVTPIAATPVFSPAGGTFSSVQTVTITDATVGASVYYTTNGTPPTTSSSLYRGPITVSSSETLQAIASASGYSTSTIASATFSINQSSSFNLTGLTSPATVTESIFVNASVAGAAAKVEYYIDNVLVDTESAAPFWMGGGSASAPNGYSTDSLTSGSHTLTAAATLSSGEILDSDPVTLEVVPSINGTFSSSLAPYLNQLSAQQQPLSAVLANTSTAGANLSSEEVNVRQAILAMYMNWGIDPSLDYQDDESAILAALIPARWQQPTSSTPAAPFSMDFSTDAPYYHAIPAQWPRVALPAGYLSSLQLNTNQQGDGIGFGESVATASSPNLIVTSEWYNDPTTLVTFPYRIQTTWTQQIPSNAAGDKHVIFIDPLSDTFISSYMTSLNGSTGGPDGLYISTPNSFNSLGTSGGSVASRMAELPVMIQPGEATNPTQAIQHAISGPVTRTWAARVFPATARDAGILTSTNPCKGSGKTNTGLVPYGGVIQLDPSLDLSKLTLTLPARRILEAMQTYGYYVVDLGCGADIDIYTAIPESELDPYGGLYGNSNGSGIQGEVQNVLANNTLYVVAPLTKKQ